MADIVERLTLEDRMSSAMTQCIQMAQRMANVLDDVRYSTMNVETATAATAQSMQDMASRMSQTTTQGNFMLTTVRNLAGAFLGMQSVRWLVGTSDQLAQINARLQMMTGSAEAAAEANEQIYQAALRSRGAYADMADLVSQLGITAGGAFGDTGELVAFAEQIQKQMAISGASGASAAAAMTQLTQGLASGVLRGEELNSVLEQTPMIAKTIADYMGVTTGQMRELASEGAVTADVVKNAILGAAEETDAAFKQMPMTWAQVWTQMQNIAIRALDPVLGGINFLANHIEIIGPIVLGLGAAFGVFLLAANWTKICTAATTGLTAAQTALSAVMATTWGPPLIAIILIIAAVYALVAAVNYFTGSSVSATGIIAGAFLTLFALIANGAILGINTFAAFGNFVGNVFHDPVAAVKILFLDMATTILGYISNVAHGIEDLINAIPGVEISITSGIDGLYNRVQGAAAQAKSAAGWVEYFKPQEYIDLAVAFQTGYSAGENFNPFGGASATGDLSQYTAGISPYDEIAGTLGDISGSVKNIDKSVSMSDEDIKALVDVAERRYVNNINLTSQTPVINVNGANTGRTAQDRRALADAIEQILLEQWASGSVRSTQYA
ncbi:MAG: tape measure protein [Oscillospiraceae bacterium]|nr:tape measure protein [Oscillospiraceae bacterium]DAO11948.1 MAG TPA: Tail tape measure [Caudoviricetes sp.]